MTDFLSEFGVPSSSDEMRKLADMGLRHPLSSAAAVDVNGGVLSEVDALKTAIENSLNQVNGNGTVNGTASHVPGSSRSNG